MRPMTNGFSYHTHTLPTYHIHTNLSTTRQKSGSVLCISWLEYWNFDKCLRYLKMYTLGLYSRKEYQTISDIIPKCFLKHIVGYFWPSKLKKCAPQTEENTVLWNMESREAFLSDSEYILGKVATILCLSVSCNIYRI